MGTDAAGGDVRPAPEAHAGDPPLEIELRFGAGLSHAQRAAFRAAAARWSRVVVGNLPAVCYQGEVIRGVRVHAEVGKADGGGDELARAGITVQRPISGDPRTSLLPAVGLIQLDAADLAKLEAEGSLADVIAHEIGHVLGVGTMWRPRQLLAPDGGTFLGGRARAEYGRMRGAGPQPLPVDDEGVEGTRELHWRERAFDRELMSSHVEGAGNSLSRLTVASLADLGYTVRMEAAEPYTLPPPSAGLGRRRPPTCPHALGRVRRTEPVVLGPDSFVR